MTASASSGELLVRGLTKSFSGRDVLRGIDLDVPAGGSVAVVGPSGCGKTTLLRLIAGFERPDAGDVRLDGRELTGPGSWVPAHKRRIGYVPQDGALFPHLTVGGNVGFGLARRDRTTARIAGLLDRVALDPEMARFRPDQLSGGQQQRVAVARALAQSPRVVLLDESFSALDAGLRAEIRSAVAGILRAGGVTALLVTHDHEEALSFADRVAVMRDGTFVQVDRPRDVYLRPADDATAEFFGEVVWLAGDAHDGVVDTVLGPVRLADSGTTAAAVTKPTTATEIPTTTSVAAGSDSPDGPVSLTIRTEQVVLGPAGARGVPGVVRDARFLGAAVRCEIEVPGGRRVIARCRPQNAPEVNDDVTLTVAGEGRIGGR